MLTIHLYRTASCKYYDEVISKEMTKNKHTCECWTIKKFNFTVLTLLATCNYSINVQLALAQ